MSYLLSGVLALILFGALVRIFQPFFNPILWALILSLYLFPLNRFLRRRLKGRRGLAAFLLTLSVVIFILIPSGFVVTEVTRQALDLASSARIFLEKGPAGLLPSPDKYPRFYALSQKLMEKLAPFETQVKQVLAAMASGTGQFLLNQGKALFKNTVQLLLHMIFMLVTLFYLFRDGDTFFEEVKRLLPTTLEETERITGKIQEVLRAVLFGGLLTGLAQGLAALLIYLILGVPSAIFLGLLTAAASFVPIVGTALIWVPTVIYLLIKGFLIKGIILLIYCVLIVSQIDSLLRPFIVGSQTEIHTLFLFFSILGGLKTFGILGIFLGPIILSLTISLVEIYRLKVLRDA
ncbi:AI-2E family transporter [Thermosulfurimonas sp. F29]|uniref:AI-2E family transporter n=1 Tax=Thermosulfurimonas sp. F29 TaxID=2867247 RepID=UPI001C83AE4E|nr:AI-2E family transporter [Thermosulfurimonas sp. F29]MBX6424063.1 AI-2E family transporter [Thermosulfurimonas sp. F29]